VPDITTAKNIAETLAEKLPKAELLRETGDILHFAVPANTAIKEFDLEKTLPAPRRMRAKADFGDAASFLAYVARHAGAGTVAWCRFDPQTFALAFTAVLDDHGPGAPGWRGHTAAFAPELSAEWKAWKAKNAQAFSQVAFAEWIQEHDEDIAAANSMPSSLQMLEMATNFVMNEERSLKSAVRLQSGGTRLTYIADPDAGTVETMSMFERFGLGIPVFHGGSAWGLTARLKYRNNGGKLSFFYELVRPDRVHEGAAKELIDAVRSGLGQVPLLMGSCG
jgi:uncharacterized protein YfdQ (DUF2303 family)